MSQISADKLFRNLIILCFAIFIIIMGFFYIWGSQSGDIDNASTNEDTVVQKKDGSIDARDNDLEELCKDWLYYRKKIMEAESAGQTKKAERHRESFQQVNAWLDEYNQSDVSAMFDRLDAEGYSPP